MQCKCSINAWISEAITSANDWKTARAQSLQKNKDKIVCSCLFFLALSNHIYLNNRQIFPYCSKKVFVKLIFVWLIYDEAKQIQISESGAKNSLLHGQARRMGDLCSKGPNFSMVFIGKIWGGRGCRDLWFLHWLVGRLNRCDISRNPKFLSLPASNQPGAPDLCSAYSYHLPPGWGP